MVRVPVALATLFLLLVPAITHSAAPSRGTGIIQTVQRYSDRYWARVSGRDDNLPPHVNGHDELAAQWVSDMRQALHGLPIAVLHQQFPTPGFKDLPANRPGDNVIVAVPGATKPKQAVIVGTHYDGEPFSKGSAYDDTSGVALTLDVARTMGGVWRHDGRPSRTVEFVLFDAEEQGLIGSTQYAFAETHGALLPKTTLMIDEEQSGVGYPMRPFGLASKTFLPSYAVTRDPMPPNLGPYHKVPATAESHLVSRLKANRGTVFRTLGSAYSPISYRGGHSAVFTQAQERYLQIGPAAVCCSDNDPFEARGVPTVTFAGNADYFSTKPKPWSYPFDQPDDTFAALTCDTGGSPQPSAALAAALDVPAAMTNALLGQYAPPATSGHKFALLSTLAPAGQPIHFAISGGHAHITFGDGTSASGDSLTHVYQSSGHYQITVTVGGMTESRTIAVPASLEAPQPPFGVLSPPPVRSWNPPQLQQISGC